MIAKIMKRSSFGNVVNYVFKDGKDAKLWCSGKYLTQHYCMLQRPSFAKQQSEEYGWAHSTEF